MLFGLFLRTTNVRHLLSPKAGRPESRVNRCQGFSLLEVVIASLIFLTALVLMTTLWTRYHSALTQSRNRLVANGLAKAVMEQRIAGGYGSLNPIVGVPQTQTFVSNNQVRGRRSNQTFDTTFEATDPGGAGSTLRRLVVTVTWEEDTEAKELVYESCLYKTQ